MKKVTLLVLTLALLAPVKSMAAWLTIQTKVEYISTYVDRDYILVTPENQNFTMPDGCTSKTIAIPPTVPLERRQQTLSVLLAAQARNATVKLTVSDNSCVPWSSGGTQFLKLIRVTSMQN